MHAEAVRDLGSGMRAVLQRVSRARVTVDGRVTGEIGPGLMILLGVGRNDTSAVVTRMAERCANLRIFEDDQGKMNRSLLEVKEFCDALGKLGVPVATGIFQAMMSVELVNEGPVTILLDSDNTF